MIVLFVALYFLVMVLLLALWLWPPWRARVVGAAWPWRRPRVRPAAAPVTASGRPPWAAWLPDWQSPAIWVMSGLLLVLALPLGALGLRHWWAFDGFDPNAVRAVDPHVEQLLRGEQLVAPAPLPPELFLTPEVEQARPMTASADRRWEGLDAEFRQRLLTVFKVMREQHGLEMVLIEGLRSHERQAQLAALGSWVTMAEAGQSWHQYGLAADCAFLFDGRIVIKETDLRAVQGYALYGAVAQSLGLVWGGSWSNIKDLGHVELRREGVMKR